MINKNEFLETDLAKFSGVIGSLLGIIGSMFMLLLHYMSNAITSAVDSFIGSDTSDIIPFLVAILGQLICLSTLVLSYMLNKSPRVIGIILIVASIMIFLLLRGLGFPTCVLLMLSGILALIKGKSFHKPNRQYMMHQQYQQNQQYQQSIQNQQYQQQQNQQNNQ
ncbi:MAG: hypothetical protein Q4F01_03330 [Staphylococcus rostri]|uniref:hypothetical protein n=1 Tax=Staphylococcus rostri TaxID=522262 RepID=UPI0026E02A7F|nr:hypothetical protein [Staphylococcus rostri]MDO5375197.1 hypothetical protein [Staphylococcus rostri]